MRWVLVTMLVCGLAATAAADPKSDALTVLDRAIAKQKQPKELEQALAELDALLVKNPKDPDAHYARGWVLSRSGKNEEAVAAYDRAFELDARLADAPYNAGVVLGRIGNMKEAIVRFERALKADPKHVDAAYNAGQSYYDTGDYAKAAAKWTIAMKLAPEDFQTAKKLVQAYVALGKPAEIKKARDRVFTMWKSGKDPELQKLKSYVYDQFAVGKYHVYVYEAFDTSGDLAYVYQFKVTQNDKTLGSVNVETSAVIREQGTPYIVGIDKDGEHVTLAQHAWKKLPDYKSIKALASRLVETRF
ncbi:MAG TPA: tetratricopeptide repeat protein [Kofleriaceae bacterium]|nr:tetratricopeptide repeat protein [Kofleriaceae bacterium]